MQKQANDTATFGNHGAANFYHLLEITPDTAYLPGGHNLHQSKWNRHLSQETMLLLSNDKQDIISCCIGTRGKKNIDITRHETGHAIHLGFVRFFFDRH